MSNLVHCAVCVNVAPEPDNRTPATAVRDGYHVCAGHAETWQAGAGIQANINHARQG